MSDPSTLESRIARAKERTSADLDRRILREMELAAAFATEAERAPRARSRVAVLAAALLLIAVAAGGLVLAGLELARRDGSVDRSSSAPPRASNDPESEVARPYVDVPPAQNERGEHPDPAAPSSQPPPSPVAATDDEFVVPASAVELEAPMRERRGSSSSVDLAMAETFRRATVIARMKAIRESASDDALQRRARSAGQLVRQPSFEAAVTAVYDGHRVAPGMSIWLAPGSDPVRRSFLAHDAHAIDEIWNDGVEFVACIKPLEREGDSPRGTPLFEIELGEGFAVTLVSAGLQSATSGDRRVALDHDLALSLSDANPLVRESAIAALRHSRSADRDKRALWRDEVVFTALLGAIADESPLVRWHLARIDPGLVTEDVGPQPLYTLLFDPVPLVREPILRERRREDPALVQPQRDLVDEAFAARRSRRIEPRRFLLIGAAGVDTAAQRLRNHEDPAVRAASAEALFDALGMGGGHLTPAAAALVDALRDPEADVRRAAAETLGRFPIPSLAGSLASLHDDVDRRVAVAAAAARVRLGDHAGVAALRTLAADADPRVAAQAVMLIGELLQEDAADPSELFDILATARRHVHAGVRGEAIATAAASFAAWAPGEHASLPAWIEQAAGDASPYVRAAAAAAGPLAERAAKWAAQRELDGSDK